MTIKAEGTGYYKIKTSWKRYCIRCNKLFTALGRYQKICMKCNNQKGNQKKSISPPLQGRDVLVRNSAKAI